ncbi:MAG: hypothetical protein IIU77_04280 [Clostridia bacterium]|nr:hypothetical protein [Clostridia bacterium]
MKNTIALCMSFLLLFCLASCANIKKDLELSQDMDNVKSIEIYKPERAYYEGDISDLLKTNEPVAVLEAETFTAFLDALRSLKFEEEKVFFPIPMDGGYDYDGYIIAVVYSDGGYDIIAEGGLYSYAIGRDGQGRHKYDHSDYCGETPWTEFIDEYIEK